jgi:hypothetical protein
MSYHLLNFKYLFAPIYAFQMYAVGYEVYRHPPLTYIFIPVSFAFSFNGGFASVFWKR